MIRALLLSLLALGYIPNGLADDYLVMASGKACAPGLHPQPAGGPFSVFLFCDGGAGSNMGVINTEGAAGPGKIELPHPRRWDKWSPGDRFWQQHEWATDITSFAWSPDLKSLYVGTSYVYGSGELYKLDLVKRTYAKLTPEASREARRGRESSVEITGVDVRTGDVTVNVNAGDPKSQHRQATRYVVK